MEFVDTQYVLQLINLSYNNLIEQFHRRFLQQYAVHP